MNKLYRKLKLPFRAWALMEDGKLIEDFPSGLPKLYTKKSKAIIESIHHYGGKPVKIEVRTL